MSHDKSKCGGPVLCNQCYREAYPEEAKRIREEQKKLEGGK